MSKSSELSFTFIVLSRRAIQSITLSSLYRVYQKSRTTQFSTTIYQLISCTCAFKKFIDQLSRTWGSLYALRTNKNLLIRGMFVFFNFVRHFLKNLRDSANTNTNIRSWYSLLRSCFSVRVCQFGEDFLPIDIAYSFHIIHCSP